MKNKTKTQKRAAPAKKTPAQKLRYTVEIHPNVIRVMFPNFGDKPAFVVPIQGAVFDADAVGAVVVYGLRAMRKLVEMKFFDAAGNPLEK